MGDISMSCCDSAHGRSAAIAALVAVLCAGAAAAQGNPPPPAVTVSPVATKQITETGDYVGRVAAIYKVDIVARISGFIEERHFNEGQMVKAGDLLFRIEPDTYKAAVDQQQANLAKAKATEANAAIQLERGKDLIHNQTISQATLDQRTADESSAQADVMQAQAALEQAKINLGYTEIHSPIDGRIGLANFAIGNLVDPSSGRLAVVVSQDPVYVTFQMSERDIIAYKNRLATSGDQTPRLAVHIKLPDGTTYARPGLTDFLDVQVDPNTDTVVVRAIVPNPDGVLIPAGIVGVAVEREAPRSALVVPQSAIQLDQAGHYVMVVDDAKKVEIRRITTGVEQGRNVVVTDGLKEGELVVVEGILKVHPGQVVAATVAPSN
jgi:membrane fusion protein, multidrug efflux system